METTYYSVVKSAIGPLTFRGTKDAITGLYFEGAPVLERERERDGWVRDDERLAHARVQLEEYLRGTRVTFDLRLELAGTPFQKRVWSALLEIPHGTTTSYGALARTIGRPDAVRAVGAANGQNPVVIIVPCHRVIGADGSLTGFGGGLPRKRWLLAHEGARSGAAPTQTSRRGARWSLPLPFV
jgi:methylated-DNA-[protein]-cysteine S-methyltransferase